MKKNSELSSLLERTGMPSNYFIKNDETRTNTVSIYRLNDDLSISQMMAYISRKEMKAYLIGYMHGKNNSI